MSATEAARRFSAVLDSVEARGETFVVVRRGRAVARIGPARAANGKALKELLRSSPPDAEWLTEVHELRSVLAVQERRWGD